MAKNPLEDTENQIKFNAFIAEHAPLINLYAKKLMAEGNVPKDIDPSDLHMAGFHGLVDALHRYDPKVGASFASYAGHRIRGKMLDHVHANYDVPKVAREQAKKLQTMANPIPAAPKQMTMPVTPKIPKPE